MKGVSARSVFVLLMASAAFCGGQPSAVAQSAQALFEKGFELFTQNDLATAERLLRMGLERDQQNALGHYYLGEALARQGKPRSEILIHYKAAARLSPDSKEGLDALVKVMRLERDEEAERKRLDQRRAQRENERRVLSSLSNTCYQRELEEHRGSSDFCICFSGYAAGESIKEDSIPYVITHKGSAFDWDQHWFIQVAFNRLTDPKSAANNHIYLRVSNTYGIHSSSIFRNTASYLASPVVLRGVDALASLPRGALKISLRDGSVWLDSKRFSGPHNQCQL